MGVAQLAGEERVRPAIVLPVFQGPLDLLLHLVREEEVSIWEVSISRICDQYQRVLREMEELDLEIAGEYLVCAAWLMALKSRLLLPRRKGDETDAHHELVLRLLEYEAVRGRAAMLAGLEEVRRGMEPARIPAGPAPEEELDLEELDVVALANAMHALIERHRREHPPALEVRPMRFSVRQKVIELFEMVVSQRSLPLLTHILTRPDREECVTLLVAALELARLGAVRAHQRLAFAEIFLTPTGKALSLEVLDET